MKTNILQTKSSKSFRLFFANLKRFKWRHIIENEINVKQLSYSLLSISHDFSLKIKK